MAGRRSSITIWLIRSGETAWAAEGRVHGSTDLPLSDSGRASVETDLARLGASAPDSAAEGGAAPAAVSAAASGAGGVAAVHHAPDEAATETARIAARQFGARCRSVDELADPNFGLLEGLTVQTFAERYPTRHRQWEEDLLTLVPPEGEAAADARCRILNAVLRILHRVRGGEVAIVLSPYGLAFTRAWLAGLPVADVRPMLEDRPRVERYALHRKQLDALEQAIESTVPA